MLQRCMARWKVPWETSRPAGVRTRMVSPAPILGTPDDQHAEMLQMRRWLTTWFDAGWRHDAPMGGMGWASQP